MANDFWLKYRDTRPILEVTLKNPDNSAHDLTGATGVKLHVLLEAGGVVSKDMVVDADPALGVARYTWVAADWVDPSPLVRGLHRMEYEVVGPAGAQLTFPNDGFHTLHVVGDVGQG